MADARTLAKLTTEAMHQFNKRLKLACEEAAVTEVSLHAIDGEPVVTLFSEMVVATDEDVKEAREDGDTELKEGDLIPEEEPVTVQVGKVSCVNDDEATSTQKRFETIYGRAQGGVVKVLKDTCVRTEEVLIEAKKHYLPVSYTFFAVVSLIEPPPESDEAEADTRMESALRSPR
jgi:hypothetical protein